MTFRDRVANALDRAAILLWNLSDRIRPPYAGPLCPDCRIAPDPGPDGTCDLCAAALESARRDRYDGDYDDGMENGPSDAARRAMGDWITWETNE